MSRLPGLAEGRCEDRRRHPWRQRGRGLHRTHSLSLPAPKVKVADTVGAGDTFTAGFLTDLQRGTADQEGDGNDRGHAADACGGIRHEMRRRHRLAAGWRSALGQRGLLDLFGGAAEANS